MGFNGAAGSAITLNLPSSVTSATNVTVEFWTYWDSATGDNTVPFGFPLYNLYHIGGKFGFSTGNSDLWGVTDATSGFSATIWHHIAAIFNNGNPQLNQLWIDGTNEPLSQLL